MCWPLSDVPLWSPWYKPRRTSDRLIIIMLTVVTAALGLQVHLPAARVTRVASVRMTAPDGEDVLLAKFGLPKPDSLVTGRRAAVGIGLAAAAAIPLVGEPFAAYAEDGMFSVPPLPYAYDALEPTIE